MSSFPFVISNGAFSFSDRVDGYYNRLQNPVACRHMYMFDSV